MIKVIGALLLVFSFSLQAEVSLTEFKKLTEIFHKEYDQELKAQGAVMIINNPTGGDPDFWWKMEARHASYSGYLDPNGTLTHFLFLFGGYARIPGMDLEGVAMTLCHELGHGIGGDPKKESGEKVRASVEGQSDYFAARYCLKRILKHLPIRPLHSLDSFVVSRCNERFKADQERVMCYRSFLVLEKERLFFRTQEGGGMETYYDRPDPTVVDKIELDPYFYPEAQCRLDTMVNGILELERPRCWWKPDSVTKKKSLAYTLKKYWPKREFKRYTHVNEINFRKGHSCSRACFYKRECMFSQ